MNSSTPPITPTTGEPEEQTPRARYQAFDELADLVNAGHLSMLGAKALWYELACAEGQDPFFETDLGDNRLAP